MLAEKSAEPKLGVSVNSGMDMPNLCMHPESFVQPCRNNLIFRFWCETRGLKRSVSSRMRVGDLFRQSFPLLGGRLTAVRIERPKAAPDLQPCTVDS